MFPWWHWMSALKGSSWCTVGMASGATLAVGLLGVEVAEEAGDDVVLVTSELPDSSFLLLVAP